MQRLVNHVFAAISTDGFSTRPEGIGYWNSIRIEAVPCGTAAASYPPRQYWRTRNLTLSMVNAVLDATGINVPDLPVTAVKVYRALHERSASA